MDAASPTARMVSPFAASASSHGCDAFPVHTRAWTTGRLASCAPAIVVQNIKTPQCSVILQKAVPRRDHRAPLEYLDIKNHHIRELHLIKRPGRWHNEGPPVQRSSKRRLHDGSETAWHGRQHRDGRSKVGAWSCFLCPWRAEIGRADV